MSNFTINLTVSNAYYTAFNCKAMYIAIHSIQI